MCLFASFATDGYRTRQFERVASDLNFVIFRWASKALVTGGVVVNPSLDFLTTLHCDMQRALLTRASAGRGAVDLAAVGTWFAALQQSASDVIALASAHRISARGFQSAPGQDALGTGDHDAWGTIPADGSPRTVQDYNTLISLMARRRR